MAITNHNSTNNTYDDVILRTNELVSLVFPVINPGSDSTRNFNTLKNQICRTTKVFNDRAGG